MKLISYTFSREELWETIKAHMIPAAKGQIEDLIEYGMKETTLEIIGQYKDNFKWQIEYWCDCCSADFFEKHPDVSDVLVLDFQNKDICFKTWIASR